MSGRPMDRLRAQTYRGPIRSASFMPWSERFEPYPSPYESGGYPGRSRRYPHYYEEGPYRPHEYGGSPPSVIVDEERTPPYRRPRPSRSYGRRASDDDSHDEFYASKKHPRGPGPDGPSPGMAEKELIINAEGDREQRKSSLRPSADVFHRRYTDVPHDELRSQDIEIHRTKSYGGDRSERRRHGSPEVDVYMRGARSENGSGDSDEGEGIRIVRS